MAKSKDAWATFKSGVKLPDYAGEKLRSAWKELPPVAGPTFTPERDRCRRSKARSTKAIFAPAKG